MGRGPSPMARRDVHALLAASETPAGLEKFLGGRPPEARFLVLEEWTDRPTLPPIPQETSA